VLPCGIDIKYPAVNKNLLNEIERNGLLLSQFEQGFGARPWSFVTRNELVVALGEALVVCEAELDSGSMRSVEFALEMGKEIYVLPQRLGESGGTNTLLHQKKAQAIFDFEVFAAKFSDIHITSPKAEDPFLALCKTLPSYDDVLAKFPQRVFEAELNGEIEVKNGKIFLL
jgi:DNA processing protein